MKHLTNILLVLVLAGSLVWGAVAPGMQALIPLLICIVAGIELIRRNTDWIQTY